MDNVVPTSHRVAICLVNFAQVVIPTEGESASVIYVLTGVISAGHHGAKGARRHIQKQLGTQQ